MLTRYQNVLLLVARLIIGGIFIGAGWMKIADMAMTVGYFGQMGLSAFLAYVVSYAEFLGGIALVLGLWAELAAIGLAVIMIGATYYGAKMAPAMNVPVFQAIMPTIALLAALLTLMSAGAGKWALRFKGRGTVAA